MLNWIIALIKGWLGISAEIKQKQAEHVGAVMQQNADLSAALKEKEHEAQIFSAPTRSESDVDAELLQHTTH